MTPNSEENMLSWALIVGTTIINIGPMDRSRLIAVLSAPWSCSRSTTVSKRPRVIRSAKCMKMLSSA